MEDEQPFEDVPGGIDIARYFLEEKARDFDGQGVDGIKLYRDGREYCYAWVTAHVDLDLDGFFLLDVRTNDGDKESTRLPVRRPASELIIPTSNGRTSRSDFSSHDHIERLHRGLTWFNNGVVEFIERH